MHRIDHPTADEDANGAGADGFTEGNPALAIPATVVTADWLNDIQENVARAITGAGIALVKGTFTQLYDAIVAIAEAVGGVWDDGTEAAPGACFGADQDNGFYRIGANNWAQSIGGVKTTEYESNGRTKAIKPQYGAETALTDAATVAVDLGAGNNFTITLGGNRTLGNPTNQQAGQNGVIKIKQDGSGGRTLAYASNWLFEEDTAPTLSTAAGAVDLLMYHVTSEGVNARLMNDFR